MKSFEDIAKKLAYEPDNLKAQELISLLVSIYLKYYELQKEKWGGEYDVLTDNMLLDRVTVENMRNYYTDLFWRFKMRMDGEEELNNITISFQILRIQNTELENIKQTAQLEVLKQKKMDNPNLSIKKQWVAYPNCCPICQALDGLTVDIDEPFIYKGQIIEVAAHEYSQYNYANTFVTNAHPNDRCSIRIIF